MPFQQQEGGCVFMKTNFVVKFKNRPDITCSSVTELSSVIRKYGTFPFYSSMTVYWGNVQMFNTLGTRILNCKDLILKHELRDAVA